MIIKRFFQVNTGSYEKNIFFNSASNFNVKNLGLFVTVYMNLHTRSQAKKLWLRFQQKVAPTPTPAPQYWQQHRYFHYLSFKNLVSYRDRCVICL
jgi:hypothetical protein